MTATVVSQSPAPGGTLAPNAWAEVVVETSPDDTWAAAPNFITDTFEGEQRGVFSYSTAPGWEVTTEIVELPSGGVRGTTRWRPEGGWPLGPHTGRAENSEEHPWVVFHFSADFAFTVTETVEEPPEPSTTWADTAARFDQGWAWIVRIEGLGNHRGPYSFCSELPYYARTDPNWGRWLREWPSPLPSRSSKLGGAPEAGAVEIEILDFENRLTAMIRTDLGPGTSLAVDLEPGAVDSMTVDHGELFGDGPGVAYVGNEAIRYTARSGNVLTGLTRGWLDTDPQTHFAGDGVGVFSRYIATRRMRLFTVPLDALSSSAEQLEETYRVDPNYGLSEDMCAWVFPGTSQQQYTARLVDGTVAGELALESFDGDVLRFSGPAGDTLISPHRVLDTWPDGRPYLKVGDEIVNVERTPTAEVVHVRARGLCGSKVEEHDAGDAIAPVIVCDRDFFGGVRWSPGPAPSTDRSSGTWIKSDQWIDIILARATSSAHPDDRLELLNHTDRGNWSSLPCGWGAGLPSSRLHWPSWLDVRARTPDYRFPQLVLGGDDPQTFAEWMTRNFLAPLGAHLITVDDQIGIALPRIPTTDEALTPWGANEIITNSLRAKMAGDETAGAIIYKLRGAEGRVVTEQFNALDFPVLFGQRGYYGHDARPLELEIPGVRADQHGSSAFLRKIAARRLSRWARLNWLITLDTDLSQHAVRPGSLVALSHPDFPDLTRGTRGVSRLLCEVIGRELAIDPEFVGYHFTLVGYGVQPTVGRVGHAAAVVSSTVAGANRVITVAPNRFTAPNESGLPVTDAAAFAAGDLLRECTRAGVRVPGEYWWVVSVSPEDSTITVVDIGRSPAPGNVLVADDDAAHRQQVRYAFWADGADRTIGAAGGRPFQYGEP